ncbi:MAG: M42 family peptidase [Oscillospiraceae bacterium]|nr:M42 family peptidase [Oscillospiraceae bacterium]
MLNYLKDLCALNGISGDETQIRKYLKEKIDTFPDILECRTDALGNLLVHKKGRKPAEHTVLVGAHMDEVGFLITEIKSDGTCVLDTVGGVDPDVAVGRAVFLPKTGRFGVIGCKPVHQLTEKEREEKPTKKNLILDIGTSSREETLALQILPADSVCYYSEWTELGGNRVASKAIDDRFGCAVMLKLLESEIAYDTWFGFFVQEEIGLRGSKTASYAVNPDFALILETTTAGDLDGVHDGNAVCHLGKGAVALFMDRATIYDKELYRIAFEEALKFNIPCQTKSRIAGGNDAGSIHVSRDGVRTLALSIPCRYLHSPYCTAQISDMTHTYQLAEKMLERIQEL